jgi:hypothetical protein
MRLKGFSAFQHAEAHLTRQTTHGAIGEQQHASMRCRMLVQLPSSAGVLTVYTVHVTHAAVPRLGPKQHPCLLDSAIFLSNSYSAFLHILQ